MSTTALDVFGLSIHLMGEADETTGATDTPDNLEYKNRTLSLLNILCQECYPLSDTYAVATAGTRPALDFLTDFTTAIGLDDGICRSVLPYGLAAHLLLSEGRTSEASFFQQRYDEAKANVRAIPREFEAIEDVYGGIRFSEFSSWDGTVDSDE